MLISDWYGLIFEAEISTSYWKYRDNASSKHTFRSNSSGAEFENGKVELTVVNITLLVGSIT